MTYTPPSITIEELLIECGKYTFFKELVVDVDTKDVAIIFNTKLDIKLYRVIPSIWLENSNWGIIIDNLQVLMKESLKYD